MAKLGATTQIFGSGKDGAREATFEGKCEVNPSKIWDGYIVVQAKYQETVGKSPENAAWLIRQIDGEMAKYEDSSRALRRPDYYIIASNTRLSAAAADINGKGEGGIDAVTKRITYWAKKLGIKDYALWHADTLRTLLDTQPTVRSTYAFWITSGDVLSAALTRLKDNNVETHLPGYLRSQLRKSRDIKTKDAGQTTGKKILLDDIFVDLPLDRVGLIAEEFAYVEFDETDLNIESPLDQAHITNPTNHPQIQDDDVEMDFDEEEEAEPPFVVRSIMERCSDKFDNIESPEGRIRRERQRSCVVLMGGPGQGKSTIGQFIAQIYRARLLKAAPGNSAEIKNTIDAILNRATKEGVPLSGPPRFPFFIDLPAYADALSKSRAEAKDLSLLSFIASLITNEESISAITLRHWLAKVPTILILDGLDEVPHSSNRNDVIEGINALIDALYDVNADCFTLVTSRPQGYQDELSKRIWAHWEMANLSSKDAIRFAEQLSKILVSDELRRQEIITDLIRASEEEATAPLMTSPLQVSLLFALVETRNNIPKDRWTLFYRYYEILRDREIAKGGENGRLIGEYRSEIDRLHYDTGYLLHLRGEKSGNASPFLNLDEFAASVEMQLARSGYEEGLKDLTNQIVTLATTRLVFLRCRTAEQVAFDVRSLQEFMAAARIMASPEDKIKRRLKEIAGMSHWLHVFKIACSKVYSSADLESLREEVLAILDALDIGDRTPEDAIVGSGSLLAVELLKDGVPGIAPASKRNLMVRALKLIPMSNENVPSLLERVIDSSMLKIVEAPINHYLRDGGIQARINTLRLLLLLLQSSDAAISTWASTMIMPWLESDVDEARTVVNSGNLIPKAGYPLAWIKDMVWRSSIRDARHWAYETMASPEDELELFQLIKVEDRTIAKAPLNTIKGRNSNISFMFRRIDGCLSVNRPPPNAHLHWDLLHKLTEFTGTPSPSTLANFLKSIGTQPLSALPVDEFPWIVLAALLVRDGGKPFFEIVSDIENKLWGDATLWRMLENRWIEKGASYDELTPRKLPFLPAQILRTTTAQRIRFSREQTQDLRNETVDTLQQLATDIVDAGNFPLRLISWYLRINQGMRLSANTLHSLQRRAEHKSSHYAVVQEITALTNLTKDQFNLDGVQQTLQTLVEKLNNLPVLSIGLAPTLIQKFNETPTHRWLLVLVAGSLPNLSRAMGEFHKLVDEAFALKDDDSDLTKEAVSLLRLVHGDDACPTALKTVNLLRLSRILRHSRLSHDQVTEILRAVSYRRLMSATMDIAERETAQQLLVEMVENAKSRLDDPAVYGDLRLPAPV